MQTEYTPARLMGRRVARVLGPEKKPNRYGRRKRLTWHYEDDMSAVVLAETVPAHVSLLPGVTEVDRVLVPITAVSNDYGLYDVLTRNRRDFEGQSSQAAVKKKFAEEDAEAEYEKQQVEDEFREEWRNKERGRMVFGPGSHRG